MNRWFAVPAVVLFLSILSAGSAKAGTAAYFATCHFIDQGNDNGGSAMSVPCYAVEGGNAYSAFFHILWKDGVQTQLNATPSQPFTDIKTGRSYRRVSQDAFVAETDGDVIVLENAAYTNERYGVDQPGLADRL